jgi:3-oxoacyl-[acyl-carrier-protein] synthase II
MKAVVVASNIITPYGLGVDVCWNGLMAGKTALSPVERFSATAFHSCYAGTVPGLVYHGKTSLIMQMLAILFKNAEQVLPKDAKLLLATIKGEIEFLEKSILTGTGDPGESSLNCFLDKVTELFGIQNSSMIISAACTSSAAAASRAAAMIRSGHADCVLVVACDGMTEFIYSGFSSLMALDKVPARPFDIDRAGLTVGEAAAYALIMSEERARKEQRPVLGEIAGWGLSDDANHMTGPSRESEGLVLAMRKALQSAGITEEQVGFIAAHGTGTMYNDAMEMRAFRTVFRDRKISAYSVKGAIGHTMGAAGLVEMIIAQRALREKKAPPTVGLRKADADAQGWVSDQEQPIAPNTMALVTNAGFSGVNTTLVLV